MSAIATREGNLVDLGKIQFPRIDPALRVVLLIDGPCAGTNVQMPGTGVECWQRVGKPGAPGVETQMWARYDCSPLDPNRYFYSGVTVTTDELAAGIRAMQADGHTYGESRGA